MGALRVTTTHLEYYSDVQRRAQALRLRNLHDEACQRAAHPGAAAAEGGPFDATPQASHAILAGDFNFPPENPAYGDIQHALAGGGPAYRDAWKLAHERKPHTPTFCVHDGSYSKSPYCCDFVFVSADAARRVRDVQVDSDTLYSDHQPVLLDFDDR
jgi:endonuclease/exonuclease/phosphatase family metal-dependent hydrolase